MSSTLLAQGISASDTGLSTTAEAASYSNDPGDISVLVGNFIEVALGFVGLIMFLIILYAGLLWMTAQGNEEQVTKAKGMITNAVIGFVIVTAAYAITYYVIQKIGG